LGLAWVFGGDGRWVWDRLAACGLEPLRGEGLAGWMRVTPPPDSRS